MTTDRTLLTNHNKKRDRHLGLYCQLINYFQFRICGMLDDDVLGRFSGKDTNNVPMHSLRLLRITTTQIGHLL